MITRTVTYKDFNGNECSEKLYFNLSKPELVKLDAYYNGFMRRLDEIKEERDQYALYEMFEKLILDSYGVKSEDGKRFVKSKELSENFYQSAAYEAFFMDLISDEELMNSFMTGLANAE